MIEEFHRILKSGCRVERLQFETAERLKPAIGILQILAWRILYLTKYARSNPHSPASEVSSELEQVVLEDWMRANRSKRYEAITVEDFVRGVAVLGGFANRKSDGFPGPKTIWQGLRRLVDLVAGYRLALQRAGYNLAPRTER